MLAIAAKNPFTAAATSQVKVNDKLTMVMRHIFGAWTLPSTRTLRSPRSVVHSGIVCSCEAMQFSSADVVILWSPLLGLQGVSYRVRIKPHSHGLLISRTEFCPAVVPLFGRCEASA